MQTAVHTAHHTSLHMHPYAVKRGRLLYCIGEDSANSIHSCDSAFSVTTERRREWRWDRRPFLAMTFS